MKVSKINFFKTVLNFSVIMLLSMSSCKQSNKSTKSKSGNNPNEKSIAATPKMNLQTAVMSGNLEIIKQHIESGTPLNTKDQMTGATPLISAITFGKTTIVKTLIDANAELNITNNDGATALHVAAFFCRIESVQMLIDAKADKTLKNSYGQTPRESVLGLFTEVQPFYEMLQQQLGPIGVQIDLAEIEKNRPVIAMMLQ
jgi:ankyrin repeat protein